MSEAIVKLFQSGGGEFISPPSVFIDKLRQVRAIIFDWDGVFNDGNKRGQDGSIFSEVDAMGTNMIRYAFWKLRGTLPIVTVMTGENNPAAQSLAQRERFHEVFFLAKNKAAIFSTFCEKYKLKEEEILFFFDDILDLEVARKCGARVMIGRKASPMLNELVKTSQLADYITGNHGGQSGLREGCELVIGLLGMYDHVVKNRMTFSEEYQTYLAARQGVETGS